MRCYLSASQLVPGRAAQPPPPPTPPLLLSGDIVGSARPWSYCCSPLSYLQSCQERQRECRGKRGEEVEGRGGVGHGFTQIVFTPSLQREIEKQRTTVSFPGSGTPA